MITKKKKKKWREREREMEECGTQHPLTLFYPAFRLGSLGGQSTVFYVQI